MIHKSSNLKGIWALFRDAFCWKAQVINIVGKHVEKKYPLKIKFLHHLSTFCGKNTLEPKDLSPYLRFAFANQILRCFSRL